MGEGYDQHLMLLQQLEGYIPYMLEEEIIYIIFVGYLPSADCIPRWEMMKSSREAVIERRFGEARERQKLQKNCKCNLRVTPDACAIK